MVQNKGTQEASHPISFPKMFGTQKNQDNCMLCCGINGTGYSIITKFTLIKNLTWDWNMDTTLICLICCYYSLTSSFTSCSCWSSYFVINWPKPKYSVFWSGRKSRPNPIPTSIMILWSSRNLSLLKCSKIVMSLDTLPTIEPVVLPSVIKRRFVFVMAVYEKCSREIWSYCKWFRY